MLLLENQTKTDNESSIPLFFRIYLEEDKNNLQDLLEQKPNTIICDQISTQLDDLVKSKNPAVKRPSREVLDEMKQAHLGNTSLQDYGVWIYYPWNNRLVHTLDKEEFIEVRTNRNRNKITRQEQALLNTKKIGIVGLSVGQSIALTIAMERTCGELRLADFDTAELSNLNRLRTGIHNLGINKTVIAAREIAEIDPFLEVKIFNDGLNKENIDVFFTEGGNLDLFVEVCDGLDIKIESRFKAKSLGIPVVMDTNDRGMLDVERFDLEPERPVFHGLVEGLNPDTIKDLSNEAKIPHILKMVGAETISTRLKASMIEVESSINTWPQLASSVVLGGALTTDVSRRILLDQYHDSGRYYVDFDELVGDKNKPDNQTVPEEYLPPAELSKEDLSSLINSAEIDTKDKVNVAEADLMQIIKAGMLAPSGGNVQPWKFVYRNNALYIFHELHFSHSLLDFNHLGSYLSVGAVVENASIKAAALGIESNVIYFPVAGDKRLAAVITYTNQPQLAPDKRLEQGIEQRLTNRGLGVKTILADSVYEQLNKAITEYPGAALTIITDPGKMEALGELLAETEKLRIIHPRGHYDTFTNELRWTPAENEEKRDGLDVRTLGASMAEVAALKIAEDATAIAMVRELGGGNAFKKMVNNAVAVSSALGIITMPEYTEEAFLKGGRAVERIWIEANLQGVSFQPISQLVFLLARLTHGKGLGMDDDFIKRFEIINDKFKTLLPEIADRQAVFIFRLADAKKPEILSLRRPIESSFINLEK